MNPTKAFQPERLQEIRKALGLTQSTLARQVGVSTSTLSAWDTGKQFPRAAALEKLAHITGVPTHYFTSPISSTGDAPAFFRSMSSATKRTRDSLGSRLDWLMELGYILQQWLDLPPVSIPDFDIPFLSIKHENIEAIASKCRTQWKLGQGPISDMLLVLENAGIPVAFQESGSEAIDGVSKWSHLDSRPYIVLASNKQNAFRSRFDAAHELGHLVMHRKVDKSRLTKTEDFRLLEQQAHYFASAFLLPHDSFAQSVSFPTLDGFLSLKPKWKTSVAAMIKRSEHIELIDEEEATRLWKYRSRRKWIRQEPGDNTEPVEQPRLLARSISMLIKEAGFSKADILLNIPYNPYDIESLCSFPRGYLSTDSNVNPPIKLKPKPSNSIPITGENSADIISFRSLQKSD